MRHRFPSHPRAGTGQPSFRVERRTRRSGLPRSAPRRGHPGAAARAASSREVAPHPEAAIRGGGFRQRASLQRASFQQDSWGRISAQMEHAARKMVRDIVKRRARAMLADRGQLEMIAPGLSELSPAELAARIAEIKRGTRSLRQRCHPLFGRIEAHNLNAAALLARLLRCAAWHEAPSRMAAAMKGNEEADGFPVPLERDLQRPCPMEAATPLAIR